MKLQRKSISSSSFSADLISEILSRLPEKSVVRFRCVSKLWLSTTMDPYFINLFETRNHRPNLLIVYKEDDELIVSSIPQDTFSSFVQKRRKSYSCIKRKRKSYSQQSTHTYRMKFQEECSFFTGSVHGLICFQTSTEAIVWNPNTSKLLNLPKLRKSWNDITTYLGYDPVEAKHKVISINSGSTCTMCGVITLGSGKKSCRIFKTHPKHTPYYHDGFGQCIKGVLYYLAYTYRTNQCVWVIMRFNVRSEKLDSIQLPLDIEVDMLISYEGRLACVYRKDNTKDNGFTLLILEDAEESKWSSKDFLAPFYHRNKSLQISFELKGFTHDGEFIYEPCPGHRHHHQSLDALFFDPVKNSYRRVRFEGEGYIHMFPNHIESQMSL